MTDSTLTKPWVLSTFINIYRRQKGLKISVTDYSTGFIDMLFTGREVGIGKNSGPLSSNADLKKNTNPASGKEEDFN